MMIPAISAIVTLEASPCRALAEQRVMGLPVPTLASRTLSKVDVEESQNLKARYDGLHPELDYLLTIVTGTPSICTSKFPDDSFYVFSLSSAKTQRASWLTFQCQPLCLCLQQCIAIPTKLWQTRIWFGCQRTSWSSGTLSSA